LNGNPAIIDELIGGSN